MLNPYEHTLNSSGTDCEDGTSSAGAIPCPACRWATDQTIEYLEAAPAIEELGRIHAL